MKAIFSGPANIAEGYYSHRGANFVAKLSIAKGEAGESDYWLFALSEVGQISAEKYEELSSALIEVVKMLSSMQTKLKR